MASLARVREAADSFAWRAAIGAALLGLAALSLSAAAPAEGQGIGSGKGGVKLKRVGRFRSPVYVDAAPRTPGLFVVEQAGRVRVLRKGKKLRKPFIDIRKQVRFGGEQGLLSIAFAPDYARSRRFYAYYTNNAGDNVVAEFRRSPKRRFRARRKSRRTVLRIPHPGQPNHNGGQLQFGPDGFLYIAPGDGGGAGDRDDSAQSTDSLLGKLLRIDPRERVPNPYTVPAGNPFKGSPGRDEIYSLGLRNPFRFSFDVISAREPRIAISDAGQERFEEIDYETVAGAKGANFGWNDFEGFAPFPGASPPPPSRHDKPILVYPAHSGGTCAVIGGYVVRDRKLRRLYRRYVYGDFCAGFIRSFVPRLGGARKDRSARVRVAALSSFGEGHRGALYAASLNGPVYRLQPKRG